MTVYFRVQNSYHKTISSYNGPRTIDHWRWGKKRQLTIDHLRWAVGNFSGGEDNSR